VNVRAEPLIAVHDVPASSAWYQQLLGCKSDLEQGHPHRQEYDRIVDGAGHTLLSFHCWNSDPETPIDEHLSGSDTLPSGRGVILGFVVDDLDASIERARDLGCELLGRTGAYPDSSRGQLLRDPDGYVIHLTSHPVAN
jgi:catechol 2,3-dioxygenase-like lactoylglutathione lyase family enzyme